MIHKFLNSTTFDGYNPYRVTKYGFDWETIEPDNPWSYIGYWGDHQIIYLLKFLEILLYSLMALGLGPKADSLADSLILTNFRLNELKPAI